MRSRPRTGAGRGRPARNTPGSRRVAPATQASASATRATVDTAARLARLVSRIMPRLYQPLPPAARTRRSGCRLIDSPAPHGLLSYAGEGTHRFRMAGHAQASWLKTPPHIARQVACGVERDFRPSDWL